MSSRVYKIAVFGGRCAGRATFIKHFIYGKFIDDYYDPIIEETFKKEIVVDGKNCMLEIACVAAQEEYEALRNQCMRNNQGFLLLYSITSLVSFEEAKKSLEKILIAKDVENVPVVFVGNQCDREEKRQVSTEQGEEYARNLNCPFFETSAKDGTHVDDAFAEIVREIDAHPPEPEPEHEPAEEKSKGSKFFKFFKRK